MQSDGGCMRKQSSDESQWRQLQKEALIKNPVSKIQKMSQDAMNVIAKTYRSDTVIGYSGGKDSLVLRHMCEQCLERPLFVACLHQNEYPSFEQWIVDTAPRLTVFVRDFSLGLDFLNEHLSFLFPVERKEKDAFVTAWQKPTFEWMKEHGKTRLITGKRIDDGNFCGQLNSDGCRQTQRKNPCIISLNPLSDWTHDELLAYIQYNHIMLPEIYQFPNGFKFGTHPWTERDRINMRFFDTFDEILEIDRTILQMARNRLDILNDYFHYLKFGGERK